MACRTKNTVQKEAQVTMGGVGLGVRGDGQANHGSHEEENPSF